MFLNILKLVEKLFKTNVFYSPYNLFFRNTFRFCKHLAITDERRNSSMFLC